MKLRSLDLNLLVVFDAIYRERSVTRAAARVGLSQPATSNALARLRGYLKDELFLRGRDGLRPTPRAVELAPRLHALLVDLEHVLEIQEFVPETAQRTVRIAAVDYFSVVIMPTLARILKREAPGIRVQIGPSVGRSLEALDQGEIDFACGAFDDLPDRFGSARLIEERYSCLLRKEHPLAKKKLTKRRYANADHILMSPIGGSRGFVDRELAEAGLRRRVSLVVNHFAAAPPIVAANDLILTAPTILLNLLRTSRHVVVDCPVDTPVDFRFHELVWHDKLSRHPGQIWLREAIIRAGREVSESRS